MDPVVIILRLVHVVAGILWVGGAFFTFRFVEPTVAELGPRAEEFLNQIMVKRKAPIYFTILSGLTVLAGTALFWIDSAGDPIGWITRDATGLSFGVGGLAAWAAFITGPLVLKPAFERLGELGAQAKAAGGPPSAELMAEIGAVQARLKVIGQIDIVLLSIAIVTMAVARYL